MNPLAAFADTLSALTAEMSRLSAQATVQGALITALLSEATPTARAKADAALAVIEADEPSATTRAAADARAALKGLFAD